MGRTARLTAIVALMAAFISHSAGAQVSVDWSLPAGALFPGVSFGVAGPVHATSSVFFGASYGEANGPDYGVYGSPNSYGSCWDAYYMYYDHCVVQTSYAPVYYSYGGWAQSWYGHGGYHGRGYYQPSYYAYVSDPWGPRWGPFWAYDPWDSYWNSYWDGSYAGSWYGGRSSYAATYHVPAYYPNGATYYAGNSQYKEHPGTGTTGRTARRRTPTASPTAPSRTSVAAAAKARPLSTTSVNRRVPAVDGPAGAARSGSGARSATAGEGLSRSGNGTTAGDREVRTPTVGRKPPSVARSTLGGLGSRPPAGLPRRVPTSDGDARSTSGTRGNASRTTGAGKSAARAGGTRGASRPILNRRPSASRSGQAARTGSSKTRSGAAARTTPVRKQAFPRAGTSSTRPARGGGTLSRAPSRTRLSPTTRATTTRAPGAQSTPARGSRARPTPSRRPTGARTVPSRGARSTPTRPAAPGSVGNARWAPLRAPSAGRTRDSTTARSAPSRPASAPRASARGGSRPTGSAAGGSTRRRNNH